ncbi:unnamed protein product [Rangifer tarandus platyrhynchus]|uniref:Uncharacterized protein n=1 Tax=Rangifer tarandus platyrhynchus TaxID=3082113 RepID=A0AC59Z2G5_RANTA
MLEDSGESSELTAWKQGKELEQKQQPAKEKAPQAGENKQNPGTMEAVPTPPAPPDTAPENAAAAAELPPRLWPPPAQGSGRGRWPGQADNPHAAGAPATSAHQPSLSAGVAPATANAAQRAASRRPQWRRSADTEAGEAAAAAGAQAVAAGRGGKRRLSGSRVARGSAAKGNRKPVL